MLEPWGARVSFMAAAAYASWLFPLAYGVMRLLVVSHAHPDGAYALVDAARLTAAVGIPLALMGIVVAGLSLRRREPRPWVAVGALVLCTAIAVFSLLEMSGVVIRTLVELLPGAKESLAS